MYLEHFGLNTEPFSIAPDPKFLFLSESHNEALAHLLYGFSHGGFVLVSGEVGTTTAWPHVGLDRALEFLIGDRLK